jgi:hypothetical protein
LEGGGLDNHVTIVRYGLFYGAYKEDTYYWEIIITGRKISIVALSVFGSAMGIERQAQMVIAVLFVCISLEISGDPYRLVNDRYRILGRLEIAALFVQWGTMWCGSMIFASQDYESRGLVVFLSILVVVMNVVMMLWLVTRLLMECAHERQSNDEGQGSRNLSVVDAVRRMRFRRMTPQAQQSRIRSRTVEASDGTMMRNPAMNVEMIDIRTVDEGGEEGEEGGEVKVEEDVVDSASGCMGGGTSGRSLGGKKGGGRGRGLKRLKKKRNKKKKINVSTDDWYGKS